MDEQRLDGGIAHAGQVVRVGPHVLRPASPHAGVIHAFLRAVRDVGFTGAPLPVGVDPDGRERLVFVDGEVPVAPYPDWSRSDAALWGPDRWRREVRPATPLVDGPPRPVRRRPPLTRVPPSRRLARLGVTVGGQAARATQAPGGGRHGRHDAAARHL